MTPAFAQSLFQIESLFKHAAPALEGLDFLERIIFFDAGAGENVERSTNARLA